MSDDLYERDILVWSEHQADLIRRLARGERVNDIDWDHVAEEIEDVGRSQLNAVESLLGRMLAHLFKVHGWPGSLSVTHWRGEIVVFQKDALRRFSHSMRQHIDVAALYRDAQEELEGAIYDGVPPRPWPDVCPFTLDELLRLRRPELEARLSAV